MLTPPPSCALSIDPFVQQSVDQISPSSPLLLFHSGVIRFSIISLPALSPHPWSSHSMYCNISIGIIRFALNCTMNVHIYPPPPSHLAPGCECLQNHHKVRWMAPACLAGLPRLVDGTHSLSSLLFNFSAFHCPFHRQNPIVRSVIPNRFKHWSLLWGRECWNFQNFLTQIPKEIGARSSEILPFLQVIIILNFLMAFPILCLCYIWKDERSKSFPLGLLSDGAFHWSLSNQLSNLFLLILVLISFNKLGRTGEIPEICLSFLQK